MFPFVTARVNHPWTVAVAMVISCFLSGPAPAQETAPPQNLQPQAIAPAPNAPVQAQPAPAQPAPSTPAKTAVVSAAEHPFARDFKLEGSKTWVDTGIDLHAGDTVIVRGDGSLQYAGMEKCGPVGLARSWKDVLRALPVNAAGPGALIGRVGDEVGAMPFLIGDKKEITATRAGRLFLGINQAGNDLGEGSFNVKLQVVPAAHVAVAKTAAIQLPPTLLSTLPHRVTDTDGRPGDMVNFLIVGPAEKLEVTFQAAGWVQVDRTHGDAVVHGILATLNKEAYTAMPMSELYLFGRAQDYGFAHAEPISVIASRHHLRIWKTGQQINGQPVWAGAATHDIGFEKDERNGGVTHKIDPNVDDEREYVSQTLSATGLVASVDHVTPPDPITEARTATGGSFHSDGRLLVLVLR